MGEAAQIDARFRHRFPRLLAASVLMGVALWGATVLLGPALGMHLIRYLALLALVLIGAAAYFGFGTLLGAFRLAEFRSLMRRRRG